VILDIQWYFLDRWLLCNASLIQGLQCFRRFLRRKYVLVGLENGNTYYFRAKRISDIGDGPLFGFFCLFQGEGLSSNFIIEILGYTSFLFIEKGNYF
jgi:hypothetical protein